MADTTKKAAERSFFVYVKDVNSDKIRRVAIPSDVQIGLKGSPAELQLTGRLSLSSTDFTVSAANNGKFSAKNDDTIISVVVNAAPASGVVTVNLPSNPRLGQLHFIKDASGTAGTTQVNVYPQTGSTIDGDSVKSLTTAYQSISLYWHGNAWRVLVSSAAGGGGGAPVNATYVTISNDATLTNERALAVGSNLTLTDGGANSSVTLDLSQILGVGAGTFTYATITADAYGRITAASSGVTPAPANATYVVLSTDATLTAERVLTAGSGISITDGGANGNVTLAATATSSLPKIDNIAILAGVASVDQSTFQAVSAFEFNPTGTEKMAPSGSLTYTAFFQPIVEVFPTGVTLEVQLFNVTSNSYVASSLLSSSLLATTRLQSVNLSGSLAAGSNVYEMHMRITNAMAGLATCKGAKLFVTWQ